MLCWGITPENSATAASPRMDGKCPWYWDWWKTITKRSKWIQSKLTLKEKISMIVKEVLAKSDLYQSRRYTINVINPYIGAATLVLTAMPHSWKDLQVTGKSGVSLLTLKLMPRIYYPKRFVKSVSEGSGLVAYAIPTSHWKNGISYKRCLRSWWREDAVIIQTKSPPGLAGIEILEKSTDMEVGFSIATTDEGMRGLFEPGAPIQRKDQGPGNPSFQRN